MKKSLLIVEESLKDLTGHWFEYINTITTAAEADNWQVDVACHKDVTTQIKEKLSLFPIFHHAYYLDNKIKKIPGFRYYGFILHSFRCLKVLWPFLQQRSRYEYIFLPTTFTHHLIAWWIISQFHPCKPKHLTLLFLTSPGVWNREQKTSYLPTSSLLQGLLLKLFRKLSINDNVTFSVQTQGAKREFETLTDLEFKLLPQPVPILDIPHSHFPLFNFACYGFARYEKGSDVLKQAISKLLSQQSDFNARFRIQWVESFNLPDGSVCQLESNFCQHQQVEIINRPLLTEDYQKLLQDTGCMILPYRNSSYYARDSRIAIEAVCLGIPIIYTKGGWLEDVVQEFGAGIGIEDENSDELVAAIVLMFNNFQDYQQQAIAKKENARQYFSGQNFCRMLLGESQLKEKSLKLDQDSSFFFFNL